MNKPNSMSIKEWLIKILSKKINVAEKTIDIVITHQFDSANDATVTNDSIEISGFGKFVFNSKRAIKQMEKYDSQKLMYDTLLLDLTLSEKSRRNTELRLETINSNIKALKPKMK